MLKPFDVAIVGGGPAALGELIRLQDRPVSTVVISDTFGGGLSAMGPQRLQSYRSELAILGAPLALDHFVSCGTELNPTGREYADYVRENFDQLTYTRVVDHVRWLGREGPYFALALDSGARQKILASNVVLATGSKPRRVPAEVVRPSTLTCLDAYRAITDERLGCFANKDVLVIGSGNTAFQLAAVLAAAAPSVTVLSIRYLGLFPLESDDPFSLRAASAPALELIAKTAADRDCRGPLNCRQLRASNVYLHVYRELEYRSESDVLEARLAPVERQVPLIRSSTAAALRRRRLRRDPDGLTLSRPASDVVVVSAIGGEANVPELRDSVSRIEVGRFVRNQDGSTDEPGVYVAGAAAGYPSVNQMVPTRVLEPWVADLEATCQEPPSPDGSKPAEGDYVARA